MNKALNRGGTWKRLLANMAVFSFVTVFGLSLPSSATGNVVKSDLAGVWQMTIIGQTGCGFGTSVYTFTLNAAGQATNVTGVHHNGCGDNTSSGDTFTINTLAGSGSGTAGLTCGTGCGWVLTIQVSPDRTIMSVADVEPTNPNNFIVGTAIHKNAQ